MKRTPENSSTACPVWLTIEVEKRGGEVGREGEMTEEREKVEYHERKERVTNITDK